MRGIAALAVAFYHTHVILSMKEYGGYEIFGSVANLGWIGVNFFFVLSGFIILFAHSGDIGNKASIGRYFWRRVARVYPIYWIFLTLFVVMAMRGIGSHGVDLSPRALFSAYSLFQIMDAPPLPLKVAWTLLLEMKFYIVFAALILWRRAGVVIMALWALAILLRNTVEPFPDFAELGPDWGLLSIWNIYFLFGMAACWVATRVTNALGPFVLALGVALLGYTLIGAPGQELAMRMPPLLTQFAIGFAAIIVGAVLCERRYGWRFPKWSLLLGDASYSIYLVHSMAISAIAMINAKLGHGHLPPAILFGGALSVSVAAGVVVHLMIEKPILRLTRGKAKARPVVGEV
ncbi:acyltransferase family protein, partial [Rhodoblastus sp.]|uniref:acyltransferase family protein n=1 Tax=Rhodoblastus sp. TaxID=1962975 RepID=UPI0035AE75E2